MISKLIVIPEYNWFIKIFISNHDTNYDQVMESLLRLGITNNTKKDISTILQNGKSNLGFIYTKQNYSIIFIGELDCAVEFAKTFEHEKGHVTSHIAEEVGIEPTSEEFQYLNQYITEKLFKVVQPFLCDHCRNKGILE